MPISIVPICNDCRRPLTSGVTCNTCSKVLAKISLAGIEDVAHAIASLQDRAVRLLQRDLDHIDRRSEAALLSDDESKRLTTTTRSIALLSAEIRKASDQKAKRDFTFEDKLNVVLDFFVASSPSERENILRSIADAHMKLTCKVAAKKGYIGAV